MSRIKDMARHQGVAWPGSRSIEPKLSLSPLTGMTYAPDVDWAPRVDIEQYREHRVSERVTDKQRRRMLWDKYGRERP